MNTGSCEVTWEMRRDEEARMLVISSSTNAGTEPRWEDSPHLRALPLLRREPRLTPGVTECLAAGAPGGEG